jgi:hypothetical protein
VDTYIPRTAWHQPHFGRAPLSYAARPSRIHLNQQPNVYFSKHRCIVLHCRYAHRRVRSGITVMVGDGDDVAGSTRSVLGRY